MTDEEASNLIEAAINKALESADDYEGGDILVDWVVVSYVTNANKELMSGYPMFFPNGEIAHYRALGLLHTALTKLED